MRDEEIDHIIKKVFTHPNAEKLEIKRIPKDTVKYFKDFANAQFVGDYGMALKYLVDNLIVSDPRIEEIWMAIEDIRAQLSIINEMPPPPENQEIKEEKEDDDKYKTMLSGKKVLIKE